LVGLANPAGKLFNVEKLKASAPIQIPIDYAFVAELIVKLKRTEKNPSQALSIKDHQLLRPERATTYKLEAASAEFKADTTIPAIYPLRAIVVQTVVPTI